MCPLQAVTCKAPGDHCPLDLHPVRRLLALHVTESALLEDEGMDRVPKLQIGRAWPFPRLDPHPLTVGSIVTGRTRVIRRPDGLSLLLDARMTRDAFWEEPRVPSVFEGRDLTEEFVSRDAHEYRHQQRTCCHAKHRLQAAGASSPVTTGC